MPKTIVKRGASWNFGPGALQTYLGWQYAAFWDANRQVSVARRELPQGDWQCVSLSGYQRTSDTNRGKGGPIARGFGDGHEKVAMGISSDGVIHLAFDHHVSTLHYRCSRRGLANKPAGFTWSDDMFGAVQDNLGGPSIASVTYPNFVRDGDRMSLYLRLNGGSGNADSHFFEYQAGRWVVNDAGSSKLIDKHWSGGNGTVNAYPHTMVVHEGRRHLTWCWRDTPDARTCHDLCYAYSDDHGRMWKNNAGETIAERGSKHITADSPGIVVLEIPPGSTYTNGGSMTVDDTGGIHILMRGPNGRALTAQRNIQTGDWNRGEGLTLGELVAVPRQLLVVAESGLYRASNAGHGTLTRLDGPIESWCKDSRFVVDRSRWQHGQTISVIGQNGTVVSVIDFSIED
ncbi:BNR repeat-containing protein [Aporhodopirellula aestuarii]|uniref:BNR repeat-containing protein n=1 Tax=Aporhodopirellula aestuarii TaxID=2950107 RepID=A0ABT0UD87_9BACT|nr:BNR repeat-containing protein [Aporhodopirellula aestuarii]MCM2374751.1 BNR repeat-containing protein [Aporhodopirellula aestuarii]